MKFDHEYPLPGEKINFSHRRDNDERMASQMHVISVKLMLTHVEVVALDSRSEFHFFSVDGKLWKRGGFEVFVEVIK